jgi:hypothetical protein
MNAGFEFPVFLRTKDSGEVKPYRSIIDMESDVEQIDVENGEYEAWDVSGIPLALSVRQEKVRLHLAVAGAPQPRQLIAAIAEYARRVGVDIDAAVLSRQSVVTALDRVRDATEAKRRASPWWRRLFERF